MKIKEIHIANMISEEISKSDIIKYVKHDKDFEKRVKEIIKDCVVDIFKTLYQNNAIFKNIIK